MTYVHLWLYSVCIFIANCYAGRSALGGAIGIGWLTHTSRCIHTAISSLYVEVAYVDALALILLVNLHVLNHNTQSKDRGLRRFAPRRSMFLRGEIPPDKGNFPN